MNSLFLTPVSANTTTPIGVVLSGQQLIIDEKVIFISSCNCYLEGVTEIISIIYIHKFHKLIAREEIKLIKSSAVRTTRVVMK